MAQQDTPVHVAHLRQHGATPDTHLVAVFNGTDCSIIRSTKITTALRSETTLMDHQVGFTPEDVSPRSMRAGGAMALLMARVDTDTICLMGRWRSNIMLRYLHTKAQTFTEGLTLRMVQHGDYALIPPAHRHLKPRSQTLGLSSAFTGLQWEAWHRIGEDLAIKLALSHKSKKVYT